MIKTSNTKYVTLKNGEPAIPLKSENGKLLVLCFMSRNPERTLWIERSDLSIPEHFKQQTLI